MVPESPTDRIPARLETSAGGVLFRWVDSKPRFLLIRDRHGKWGLPKGHVEDGETVEETALREIREETSLTKLRIEQRLRTIDWYFSDHHTTVHKYCHFFLVEAPDGDAVPLEDEGISECRWYEFEEALERISYANAREVVAEAGNWINKKAAPGD